ncbi:MAG: DUF3887 domain-containing protein [Lachnospiraceae bacterium]|nr:DUF3887 domain-containing protein [Lachnospiraceae bacterium]
MKRRRGFISMILLGTLFLLLFAGCQSQSTKLSDKFDEETVKAEAVKLVETFNKREYQSIIDQGSKELKDAVTAEDFAAQSDPYLDKDGAFQKISKTVVMGNEDKKTGETYGGVVMIGEYENGKIQFTIGFNEAMELVQFVIR